MTTTNVFAEFFYGDGGLLSNISSNAITQPFANLVVSNSVTTTNVFAATEVLTGTTGQTTLKVMGNIYVSNALTTTNVFAADKVTSANVFVENTLNVVGAMTSNVFNTTFFYDTLTIPYINTQVLDVSSVMTFTGPLATLSNLYVPGNANIDYLSVSNLAVTGNLYITATNVQTTNALTINNSGTMTALKVTQNETSIHTHNVAEFWDATTLAMVIDPEGNVAIHTVSSPGYALTVTDPANFETLYVRGKNNMTSLNVIGNVYASNALVAPNIYGTSFVGGTYYGVVAGSNTLSGSTQSLTGITGQTTLSVTGNVYASNALVAPNIYASNAVTTTNLFASKTLSVGSGTLGSNVVVFSNISGGSNTFVMDSNGRVTIGSTYTGGSLLSFGQVATGPINKIITLYDGNKADDPINSTNFSGFGINGQTLRYQVADTATRHAFFGGTTEYARITGTGVSILTGANPTSNLQVTGNAYISNSVTTTNVFANTLTMSNATSTINVTGNIFASNAVTTNNLFANTLTMSNATSTINVTGNIFASNAVTTNNLFTAGITSNVTSTIFNSDTLTIPFVYSTTLNVASTSNLVTVEMQGSLGATTLRVTGNVLISNALTTQNLISNLVATGNVAPTIASSATIAPASLVSFVSGTTAIVTITAPWPVSTGGTIMLIPTGLWTTTTAGNIALASTAVLSRTLHMTWDSGTSKWYPSY